MLLIIWWYVHKYFDEYFGNNVSTICSVDFGNDVCDDLGNMRCAVLCADSGNILIVAMIVGIDIGKPINLL